MSILIKRQDADPFSRCDMPLRFSVIGTIIAGVAWFVFIVLFLAFYAVSYDLWQKLAVFLASAAIVGGAIAVFWANWALKKE